MEIFSFYNSERVIYYKVFYLIIILILPSLPKLLDIDSSLRGGSSKLKSRKKGENRAPFSQQTSSPFRVTSEASPRGAILHSLAARANFLWTAFPQAWRSFAQLV